MTAVLAALAALGASAADPQQRAGVSPGPGVRYATDAYPGFDGEDGIVRPEKKTPRWFAFINGPKMTNATEQFAWAGECAAAGSWGKARRAYDALVREWPTAPEAPKAQEQLAKIWLEQEDDAQEAFEQYRYLLDFYSLQCDFDVIAAKLYEVAGRMREQGKTVMFFRFANTVDVRRAFEAVVLRVPGASYAPAAMTAVAELRVDEGCLTEAVTVYENLRNHYPGTPEALASWRAEAEVRMRLLRKHGYNRNRVRDTADYLKQALRAEGLPEEARGEIEGWLGEAEKLFAEDAWLAAKFYDSTTRTKRSAMNAYEEFLRDYPTSPHADEARARLEKLRGLENPNGGKAK